MSADFPTHVHAYGRERRVDQCHFMLIVRECVTCGATVEHEQPRDFENEYLNTAFARQDCARCRELLRGREPAAWTPGRA